MGGVWTVVLHGLWNFHNCNLLKAGTVLSSFFIFEFLVLTLSLIHRLFSIEDDDRLGRFLFPCNLKGD